MFQDLITPSSAEGGAEAVACGSSGDMQHSICYGSANNVLTAKRHLVHQSSVVLPSEEVSRVEHATTPWLLALCHRS